MEKEENGQREVEVSLAVGSDKVTAEADRSASTSRGIELRRVGLSHAVGLDEAVTDTNRSSKEKRGKAAKWGSTTTQEHEPHSVNDHIDEQMDVDVEELVSGAARTTPLETPGLESTSWWDGLCGKTRLR